MEDSFRVRVNKTFGSLTPSSSGQLNALWCLTDEEIERDEWNRDKEVSQPRSNNLLDNLTQEKQLTSSHAQLEKDLNELDVGGDGEEDGQEEKRRSQKPDDYSEEEWAVKSCIGLDCTLDFEEEEDEYDKVAVGSEKRGERLYMKDVNDYETEADDWDELPTSFKEIARDQRANHFAAKLRLKEDVEAAKKMDSLHVSEGSQDKQFMSASENRGALGVSENEEESNRNICETRESQAPAGEVSGGLKPILKRKDIQNDPKLQKRVRFSSDYCGDERGDKDSAMETLPGDESEVEGIPDYMRNPSKYTRYTLDSGEMDEESNRKAYMDFLNLIKRGEKSEEETPGEDPLRRVAFVPKRKAVGESEVGSYEIGKASEGKRGVMAVDTVEDDEAWPMEEDVPSERRDNKQRCGRRYRNKVKEEEPDEC